MAEISVEICGRRYPVACEDGQEGHLAKLAAKLDNYAKSFDPQNSAISEPQLLLMTALMVADELSDAEGAMAALKKETNDLKARAAAAETATATPTDDQASLFDGDLQAVTTELLNQAADRMERLAEAAEKAA